MSDPTELVDVDRYPVADLDAPAAVALVSELRSALRASGMVQLPGFVTPDVLTETARFALAARDVAHLEDVWGTPYLERPDESFPPDHPRRHLVLSRTWVLAYDQIPADQPLRRLYEWPGLTAFLGSLLQIEPLHRMADPLGALNVAVMDEGHVQGWHYDNADFVVSLAVQSSTGGGHFECAPRVRSDDDECYEEVAGYLDGRARPEVYPMTPGTLMVFLGRHSLHRVSPVDGATPRIVALLAWDRRPDADSSPGFKRVRYGRSEALTETA